MSFWSYVRGMIEVYPMGRTQAEMRYILETVLSHLPPVTGSEGNMKAHIVQKSGFNYSSSADEFGQDTGMGNSHYGRFFDTQSCYFLVVEGDLRDRLFDHAYEEFQKWLCRLAKRVRVKDVMVKINEFDQHILIQNDKEKYTQMYEDPSWGEEGSMNWCEYLMWDTAEDSYLPEKLAEKYKKEGKYR